MATICRLLIDPPRDGPWNMAVDETLLLSAAENGLATLRFYQWSEPTLSLGYFQRYGDREQHAASRTCAVVRRPSGGGAILHDRELTYCLALPANHPQATNPDGLYRAVHQALVDLLREEALRAAELTFGLCESNRSAPGDAFLCFQRRAAMDVLATTRQGGRQVHKIAGSAQRRRLGAVLQHGSVLLAGSPHSPELPGLKEIAGQELHPGDLAANYSQRLSQRLRLDLKLQPLQAVERSLADQLAAEKFASSHWMKRR